MRTSIAIAAVITVAGTSAAQTYTFDGLAHGEILTNQLEPALTISGQNFAQSFDIVAVFDTQTMGGPDPDLQGPPWSGGNLAVSNTEVVIGNAIILAENDVDANNDGILDNPDDEAARPAGLVDLGFASPIPVFGLDIVDIEGVVEESSNLQFFAGGSLVGTVDFTDFTDNGSAYFDPTVSFGNNSANRISPIVATDFGVAGFDRVVINVGGSSAYDTFVVPAPASAAIAGVAGLASVRRRR